MSAAAILETGGRPAPGAPARSPAFLAAELWRRQPVLTAAGVAVLALLAPCLAAHLVEGHGRTLNGLSVWIKPMKFQASMGLYLLTLAWFSAYAPERFRAGPGGRTLAGVAAAAGLFEVAYITLQAARGEASHYNVGDPFHAAMYGLMGVAAVALTGCALALGLVLARTGGEGAAVPLPRPYLHSVALGLVLTFVLGAGAGAVLSTGDGHWIGGARTDAGGVPLFGWSRTGGDLRVAHFLGMHVMHALPALGALLARLLPLRRHGLAVAGVRLGAALYAGLTAAAFLQALRGEPLVPL